MDINYQASEVLASEGESFEPSALFSRLFTSENADTFFKGKRGRLDNQFKDHLAKANDDFQTYLEYSYIYDFISRIDPKPGTNEFFIAATILADLEAKSFSLDGIPSDFITPPETIESFEITRNHRDEKNRAERDFNQVTNEIMGVVDEIATKGANSSQAERLAELSKQRQKATEKLSAKKKQLLDSEVKMSTANLRYHIPGSRKQSEIDAIIKRAEETIEEDWQKLNDFVKTKRDSIAHEPSYVYTNLAQICDLMGLEEPERRLLFFSTCLTLSVDDYQNELYENSDTQFPNNPEAGGEHLNRFYDSLSYAMGDDLAHAAFANIPKEVAVSATSKTSDLVRRRLIMPEDRSSWNEYRGRILLSDRLMVDVQDENITLQKLRERYIGKTATLQDAKGLTYEDNFKQFLGRRGDKFKSRFAEAKGKDEICNGILYGGPGLGKTQFAIVMGLELGYEVYLVPEKGEDGKHLTPTERLSAAYNLMIALKDNPNAMIIWDEMDKNEGQNPFSGIYGFRILETGSKAKLIGIVNKLDGFPGPFLTRFKARLPFSMGIAPVRESFWRAAAEKYDHSNRVSEDNRLTNQDFLKLSWSLAASPRLVEQSIEHAVAIDGNVSDIIEFCYEQERIENERIQQLPDDQYEPSVHIRLDNKLPPHFGPEYLNAEVVRNGSARDLTLSSTSTGQLAQTFRNSGKSRYSVIVYGPEDAEIFQAVDDLTQEAGRRAAWIPASELLKSSLGDPLENFEMLLQDAQAENKALVFYDAEDMLRHSDQSYRDIWKRYDVPLIFATHNEDLRTNRLGKLAENSYLIKCRNMPYEMSLALFKKTFEIDEVSSQVLATLRAYDGRLSVPVFEEVAEKLATTVVEISDKQIMTLIEQEVRKRDGEDIPSHAVGEITRPIS